MKEKAYKILLAGEGSGKGGVSAACQGSKIYVLFSERKGHKSFCPSTRPGRPVTGVTGQSFM